jgi:drug/metabolite transporter (DMT)-like permease
MIGLDLSALLALAAALSWTLAGIFGHQPARDLGSIQFNRLRMVVSMSFLLAYCLIFGKTFSVNHADLWLIFFSGLIGAAGGDYFLFKTMQRMGPRRTGILFAANAPIAAMLGWVFLGEVISPKMMLAIALGFTGIVLAVIYGKRRDLVHTWEDITPPLWIGIGFGLLAALGQAIGVMLMRPVMVGDMDPAVAGLFRVMVAVVVFWMILPVQSWAGQWPKKFWPDRYLWLHILGNGFFGMAFGMGLLLKALESGSVAMVSILSATSPLMMLPFVWARTKLMPPLGAWIGALLVVLCSALLF